MRRPSLPSLLLGLLLSASALADEPPPEAVLATLPFLESGEINRIFVDLAREDSRRRLRLMLDTGASASVLTPGAARDAGVRVRRLKRDPYRRRTLVGRDLLFHINMGISDRASRTGWEYGLLGGTFLADYVVELDFDARVVRLLDPQRYAVPETAEGEGEGVLPIDVVANRAGLEMTVQGRPVRVLLDTGAPYGLILSGGVAKEAGVPSRVVPGFQMGGVFGEVSSELGEAARIAIGPFEIERYPVAVAPNGFFNQGFPADSILGYDLLSQFEVRIDYPRKRLWLRRRESEPVRFLGVDYGLYRETGALLVPHPGGYQVLRVQEGSLAASRGLTAGQVLVDPVIPAAEGPRQEVAAEDPAPLLASGPVRRRVWLDVAVPAEGTEHVGRIAWTEVRGWAGADTPARHDVVVVVDVSGSTAWASGADVDGDGKLGKARRQVDRWRSFNPRHRSSDPGDTVLAAELLATRRLLELLDPERNRVGLVSFADGATELAPVGSGEEALAEGLDLLEENFGSGATNLAAALDLATKALVAAGGEGRQQSILVLSDGYPTAPGSPEAAADRARERAEEALANEVRIYTFALGFEEIAEDDVYAAIAARTGGRYLRLDEPGEIVRVLPRINLARVAGVDIRNQTTGAEGRAVRVFPDGSFDAFVPLARGENVLRITARGEDGSTQVAERRIFYDARAAGSPEEAVALEAEAKRMEEALRLRAVELELAAEARRPAPDQHRELDLRVDETNE